jgi:hypothetical protein
MCCAPSGYLYFGTDCTSHTPSTAVHCILWTKGTLEHKQFRHMTTRTQYFYSLSIIISHPIVYNEGTGSTFDIWNNSCH